MSVELDKKWIAHRLCPLEQASKQFSQACWELWDGGVALEEVSRLPVLASCSDWALELCGKA